MQNFNMSALKLPEIIFGTSSLGNLYTALSEQEKLDIVATFVNQSSQPAVFDSAGKYGAGLALKSLGKALRTLNIPADKVLISNKLGWYQKPLETAEPTFEPGVWVGLQHDAEQRISYEGILECYHQGNALLNGYDAQMVSVHDPDEYLAAASSYTDKALSYQNIIDAYRALHELKAQGKVKAIGIGAKNWRVIEKLSHDVELDWVMFANSMTLHSHPAALTELMVSFERKGICVINSAVFNGGFLLGQTYYNYKPVTRQTEPELFTWRDSFEELCRVHNVDPITACLFFGRHVPGVQSIALSTSNSRRIKENQDRLEADISPQFWNAMVAAGILDPLLAPNLYYKSHLNL